MAESQSAKPTSSQPRQTSPPSIDHLILYLPRDPLTSTPRLPQSLKSAFTIHPGGTHADGLTANVLIPLADNSYIEIIWFLPSAPADSIRDHWWGSDADRKGWADWCLTTFGEDAGARENWEGVNSVGKGEKGEKKKNVYARPIRGGRKRPDGVSVEWDVTFPLVVDKKGDEEGEAEEVNVRNGQALRGLLPFFCHDVTPRHVRVPAYSTAQPHPCGALAVLSLTVLVRDMEMFNRFRAIYAKTLRTEHGVGGGAQANEDEKEIKDVYEVSRVQEVGGLKAPRVILKLVVTSEEKERVKERGFAFGDVVFAAKARKGEEEGTVVRIDGMGGEEGLGGVYVRYE